MAFLTDDGVVSGAVAAGSDCHVSVFGPLWPVKLASQNLLHETLVGGSFLLLVMDRIQEKWTKGARHYGLYQAIRWGFELRCRGGRMSKTRQETWQWLQIPSTMSFRLVWLTARSVCMLLNSSLVYP